MGPFDPPVTGVTLTEAQQELPGWDIWHVDGVTIHSRTWSAKPAGATAAVPGCSGHETLDDLVKVVKAYQANLPARISETRKLLEETPNNWIGRREMLRSRLDALQRLDSCAD